MSSSFGGGGQGQIRYIIAVDDSQAVQKLQGVSQQFTTLGNSTEQATQQMQKTPQALDNISKSADKAKLSSEQLALSQKSIGSVLQDSIVGIGLFASGIVGLIGQYTSLQRAQNTLQRAQNIERTQVLAITNQRNKLNETVAKYGANSAEAKKELEKLNIMEAKHSTQIDKIDIMQEQLNQRTTEFYIQIIPSVIQASAGLFDTLLNVKKWMDARKAAEAAGVAIRGVGISTRTALIGTGIGAIIVTLGTALIAFTQNWYGFRDAVNAVGVTLGNFAGGVLKPVLFGLQQFGNFLTEVLGGTPQTAGAAVSGLDDVAMATENIGKESGKTQQEIDELWETLGEAPLLTEALDIKIDKKKLTEKLLDYLPDSMSKEIKLFLETKQSVQVIRDGFEETIAAASELDYSDAKIDRIVDQTIKLLGEKFPDSPQSQLMQQQLADTVAGNDTLAKVQALVQTKWKIPITGQNMSFEMSEQDWIDAGLSEGGIIAGKVIGDNIPSGINQAFEAGQDIGKTAKAIAEWLGGGIDTIVGTLLDRGFWISVGLTTLGFISEGMSRVEDVKKGITQFLTVASQEITNGASKLWQAGKDLAGQLWEGMKNFFSLKTFAELIQQILGSGKGPTPPDNNNNPRTLRRRWDSTNPQIRPSPVFSLGSGDLWGDQGIWSRDMMGSVTPIFPGGGFATPGVKNPQGGTDFRNMPISLGDSEDKGKEINKFDQIARQIVQITSNLNQMARAIVQVTKNINQLARATVTQTKDNDQLARTIAQITKNNNVNAKTIVTVTKDLNQLARSTSQNTKNNNTFAKTIVETSKDFNTMAKTVNQNTKNLNTFARAVNQSTNNVEKLTSALKKIPNNVNVRIRVGLSGAGSPFIDQLL